MKNLKQSVIDFLILLPIWWTFSGLFLYPNGKKAIVALIVIAVITTLLCYGKNHIAHTIKTNRMLWLLTLSSIFAILADSYYGYSSGQLRAFVTVTIYLAILPPVVVKKIDLKHLTILGALTALTYTSIQIYIYHTARMWSINPIPYATFIATIAILALYFLLQSKAIKQAALWFSVFIAALIPLFNSQSRGLWLAFAIALLALLVKFIASKQRKTGGIALLVIIASSLFMMQFDSVTQRIQATQNEVQKITNGDFETSIGHRFQMWKAGFYLIDESPLIGLGDSHIKYKQKLAEQGVISHRVIGYPHYHNQYLDALVKYGITGLFLLLCSLFLPVYYFFKGNCNDKWPGLLVVLIFVIAGLTDVPFRHAQTLTLYFLISYITLCFPNEASINSSTQREMQ